MSHWFDNLTRIVASPMPRRTMFRMLLGALGGGALTRWLPGNAQAAGRTRGAPVEEMTRLNAEVSSVIRDLRDEFGAPISFVDASDGVRVNIGVRRGTVDDVLKQVRDQGAYQVSEIRGRLVLHPADPVFDATIGGVDIQGVSRLDAARQYAEYLRSQKTEFETLAGVAVKGDAHSPVFTSQVALSSQGRVIEHLVELLGDDPDLAFGIETAQTGVQVMYFSKVNPPAPQQAAGTCRPLGLTYANQAQVGCAAGRCGDSIRFDVTAVIVCPGDNCQGARVTETVTTDNGCGPGAVTTGAGCPIGAGNAIAGCTDTYALCLPTASVPAGGCTERYTQRLFVDGILTEVCTLTFRLTIRDRVCTGTVARTCEARNRQEQCCRVRVRDVNQDVLCPRGQCCDAPRMRCIPCPPR